MRYIGIFILFISSIQNIYSVQINLVVSRNTTATEEFAGRELQKYLQKITDEEIRISYSKSPSGFNIVIKNLTINEADKLKLSVEGYIIRTSGSSLVLSGGGNRGTLFAVYDFLEKLGCKWYYMDPSDEVVPNLSSDEVIQIASDLNLVEQPDFDYRIYQFQSHDIGNPGSLQSKEAFDHFAERIDWLCKNRINTFQFGLDGKNSYVHWPSFRQYLPELQKRDMIAGISGHSYFLFLPDSIFNQHQEWWPEINGKRERAGQFCTSNKEVVNYYINNIISFLRENPEIKYFTVWPADTYGWCNCNLCRNDISVADRYLRLSKEIHKAISVNFPDIIFNHFAYGSHLEAPLTERPPSDMLVTVCTWGRDFKEPFTGMSAKNGWAGNYYKDDFIKEFESWRSITESNKSPMIFHEKYIRHLGFGFLPLPLKVLQEDFQYFKFRNINGFELPMGFMGVRTKSLNFYTTAKLMWDVDTDIDLIEEDYFRCFYGTCASLMQNAYEYVVSAQPNLKYFTQLQKLERDISPIDKYSGVEQDYAVKALFNLDLADKYVQMALINSSDDKIRDRIKKFQRMLYYIDLEYRGLLELTLITSHLLKAYNSGVLPDIRMELKFARENLEKVSEISIERKKFILENAENGLCWDVNYKGAVCIFYDSDIIKFEELIQNLYTKEKM